MQLIKWNRQKYLNELVISVDICLLSMDKYGINNMFNYILHFFLTWTIRMDAFTITTCISVFVSYYKKLSLLLIECVYKYTN